MSQDRSFVWRSHPKWLGLGLSVPWGRGSENHPGRANSISQVDDGPDMEPSCACWRWCQQRNNGFSQHFCLGERCLSNPFPKARKFSSSPNVPVAFQVATPALELKVSESVSKSFRRKAWDSSSPPSQSAIIPADFLSQKLWGLLFPTLEPGLRGPDVGLGLLTPQGGPPQKSYLF